MLYIDRCGGEQNPLPRVPVWVVGENNFDASLREAEVR
jgi:hypothetical protein